MGSSGNEPTEVSLLIPSGTAGLSSAASSSAHSHGNRHYHSIFKKRNATEKIFQKDKELAEKLDQQQPKLGTFGGVFLPTALNVLSILMFLRFGFIVGQLGIAGSFITLVLCYTINLLTTLSVSAIATNGVVRTGGAYYMISRSLGPEFGGAIGLIFYFGQILNSALNVVGLIEPLLNNFGADKGTIWAILPESYTWSIVYSTIILCSCVSISLVGADMVSRAALLLFIILMTSILSVPVSALFVSPFDIPSLDTFYSGISWQTFKENLLPQFTKHAAGSQINGRENFANLFGIFFPATAGILAGASMSGSLANPSKSIPKGTLWGLLLTFFGYGIVILSLGVSVPRDLLHKDVQVIQTVSFAEIIIILGEFSTSVFSIIMGVVGAADILSAISKDVIIPGLSIFANKHNNPVKAILFSWLLIQAFLFANINQIATLITMAFLMTFIVINVACFLLEISAAPNFRPSFDYFNRATAAAGVVACLIAMFIVDGISASMIIFCLLFLIITIHYVCPPKSWGDVSQTLIYHQVRKYLFKLRQDNVKYWRPQILLLVDNPRTCWNLMHFCNHLKKGGLYILGHVIISTNDFEEKFDEYTRERTAWIKLRDMLNLKAFVQFSFSASLPWGVRNIFLGSGLGSMKPNIIVIGFLDLSSLKSLTNSINSLESQSQSQPPYTDPSVVPRSIERLNPAYSQQVGSDFLQLPTDHYRGEKRIKVQEWVQCIEELLLMKANVAVAKGFPRLCIPDKNVEELDHDEKAIIDLYPIQMSAEIAEKSGQTILSTNFDTYTLILQLGAILTTVPQWNKTHRLRIVVFVEENEDVEEERDRLTQLIGVLRINAEILVLCFNSGDFSFYDYIAKNKCVDKKVNRKVNKVLVNNEWWKAVTALRLENLQHQQQQQPQHDYYNDILTSTLPLNLRNSIRAKNNNITLSRLQRLGVNLKMRTSRLLNEHISGSSPRYDFSDLDSNDSDSDLESVGGYDSDPETAIRKQISKPKTLASERRMRRKTFSNVLGLGSASAGIGSGNDSNDNLTGPKTPKSPFFDKRRVASQQQQPKSQQQQQQQQEQQQAATKNSLGDFTGETLKRPTLSRQNSKQSYTSLRNQARPNFSSQAMPKSKVNEEATGLEPSIMFAAEDDNVSIRSKSRASSIMGTAGGSKRISGFNKTSNLDGAKEKSSLLNGGGGSGNDFDWGSAFDKDDKSANKYKYAAAAAEAARAATGAGADAAAGAKKRFDATFSNSNEDRDSNKGNSNVNNSKKIGIKARKGGKSTPQGTNGIVEATDYGNAISSETDDSNNESDAENDNNSGADTDADTDSEGREFDVENLSFNDLPARAQHLILNQLMMKTSKNSSIIFTTLPTPPVGCHKKINDSVDYVETLELWCRGLPPVVLINSRTMTVTTAL